MHIFSKKIGTGTLFYAKSVSSGGPQLTGVLVHRFHQGRHMLRRGELADAVPQVEDVCRA